jgi:hypothetical protein
MLDTLQLEAYAILDRLQQGPGADDIVNFAEAVKWIWVNTKDDDKVRDLFILAPAKNLFMLLDNEDGHFSNLMYEQRDYTRDVHRSL